MSRREVKVHVGVALQPPIFLGFVRVEIVANHVKLPAAFSVVMPGFDLPGCDLQCAKEIEGSDQLRLGLMDMTVRRNAFGRQVDSFEADLDIAAIGEPAIRAVFIRAPFVTEVRGSAKAIAALDTGEIVMVRQGNLLAAAPELTDDVRVHQLFANMAVSSRAVCTN